MISRELTREVDDFIGRLMTQSVMKQYQQFTAMPDDYEFSDAFDALRAGTGLRGEIPETIMDMLTLVAALWVEAHGEADDVLALYLADHLALQWQLAHGPADAASS